jgi:sugar lactone lactonase YvrE
LAFDAEGNLWVTEVTRNAIYRIDRDGNAHCLFEDPEAKLIDFPASIAFGGLDRKSVFVGSIRMDHLLHFRSSVAGAPLWHHH